MPPPATIALGIRGLGKRIAGRDHLERGPQRGVMRQALHTMKDDRVGQQFKEMF